MLRFPETRGLALPPRSNTETGVSCVDGTLPLAAGRAASPMLISPARHATARLPRTPVTQPVFVLGSLDGSGLWQSRGGVRQCAWRAVQIAWLTTRGGTWSGSTLSTWLHAVLKLRVAREPHSNDVSHAVRDLADLMQILSAPGEHDELPCSWLNLLVVLLVVPDELSPTEVRLPRAGVIAKAALAIAVEVEECSCGCTRGAFWDLQSNGASQSCVRFAFNALKSYEDRLSLSECCTQYS